MSGARDISELEELLGHSFAQPGRLATALTHRSYANEGQDREATDNERLEFLGDAVLDLLVSHYLMVRFPELSEGELSMTRAQMVSEAGLTKVAQELSLGEWLRLGKGEERSGGRSKSSLLSDALEAVVAAIYLDAGLEAARAFVIARFAAHTPEQPGVGSDYKTRLQELAQSRWKCAPAYQTVAATGPDHDKCFEVTVSIDGEERARASGRSKKAAEQAAAKSALQALEPRAD